ncbi:unnamed protein product [Prorocentrum cordatum]|uniref:Uncharacterized protein n=1 Tax=Prorocentrum cordatum TaxID=2364126 RepID=A0ABN9RFK5_9DINO|nr:unnamed protein product [Polarella glacialis]
MVLSECRRRRAPLVRLLLLGSTLAASLLWAAPPKGYEDAALALVKEPDTGVVFGDELNEQALVATGTRKKFGSLSVYAVGLYLDKKCKMWGSAASAPELLKQAPGKATLRLVRSPPASSRTPG